VRNFGARFASGALNHPALANERRALILAHAYRETRHEVNRGLDAVLTLLSLIGDSTLANGVNSCLDALGEAHVSESISRGASWVIANQHELGVHLF
jgi:hypothetical protein